MSTATPSSCCDQPREDHTQRDLIDRIVYLERALAYEARVIEAHALDIRSLSAERRKHLTGAVAGMRAVVTTGWADRYSRSVAHLELNRLRAGTDTGPGADPDEVAVLDGRRCGQVPDSSPTPQGSDAGSEEEASGTADSGGRDRELLALIRHMDGCIRRGGPSNYAQLLYPAARALLDEALADQSD